MRTRATIRTVGLILAVLVTCMLMPEAAAACDRCFGMSVDTATTRGISMAMLGLLGVLGIVWGGIGMFFINMRRRAKMLEPGELMVNEEGDIEPRDPTSPDSRS